MTATFCCFCGQVHDSRPCPPKPQCQRCWRVLLETEQYGGVCYVCKAIDRRDGPTTPEQADHNAEQREGRESEEAMANEAAANEQGWTQRPMAITWGKAMPYDEADEAAANVADYAGWIERVGRDLDEAERRLIEEEANAQREREEE